jgi:YD repeat-containing protein
VVKTLSQGKVLQKTQYDGAGRVVNEAVSYDAAETAYADADDLGGDTVVQETRLALDATGGAELTAVYERRHNGTEAGGLTVGSSGNARAQYLAAWFDKLHRPSHSATYGTNGGTDMTARPTGNPPSTGTDQLVTTFGYETKGENEEDTTVWPRRFEIVTDPMGIKAHTEYDDAGHVFKRIDNYVDGTPGTDDDRTVEYTYNSAGQLSKITAKATSVDQVTEYVYGVSRGVDNSTVSSLDHVKTTKYPNPSSGQPSTSAEDQEVAGWSAQGELLWRKDQLATEHVFEYDARGRLEHDRVTALDTTALDGAVRCISRSYDALDRLLKVTSWDNATVGSGSVVNELQYEYGRYDLPEKIYQEWAGAVNTGTSRKVQFAYSYPTDGTTGLRRTSTTTTGGTVVTDEYNSGMDDTLSRLSGRKQSSSWLFQESYLGLGRLVERGYGPSAATTWTLVGIDGNDNYVGLDRFGRIDDLTVKNSSTNLNRWLYTYNPNSQITYREDTVGGGGGSSQFSEKYILKGSCDGSFFVRLRTSDTKPISGQSLGCRQSSRTHTAFVCRATRYGGDSGTQGSPTRSPSASTTSLTSRFDKPGPEPRSPGSAVPCGNTGQSCTFRTKRTCPSRPFSGRPGGCGGTRQRSGLLGSGVVSQPCLQSAVEGTFCSGSTRSGSLPPRSWRSLVRC